MSFETERIIKMKNQGVDIDLMAYILNLPSLQLQKVLNSLDK